MSGWRTRSSGIVAGVVAALALAACGSGARQDAGEPSGSFAVAPVAHFPTSQRLAQRTRMVIAIRNVSGKTIPNIAVTICNTTCRYPSPPGAGTDAQAFGYVLNQPYLANPSRPIWIVDRAPGPCRYSCLTGGPGGAVTAYSNTWALGALPPGRTAVFVWGLTAVKAGTHVVAWQVAAGLNGKAKAVLPGGGTPEGTIVVRVNSAPLQEYVTSSGQVVTTPQRAR